MFFLCAALPLSAQVTYDSIVYSRGTFFGSANNDSYLLHVAVDAQGYVYGTGLCSSIPTTAGAYKTSNQGGVYDAMVFKLDPTMKTLIWATYIGGSNVEAGGGIAVNSAGEVYLTGYTLSPNFPTTVAADQAYLASGTVNYFALKLSADGSTLLWSRILGRGAPITQQTQVASKGAHIAINPSGEAYVFSHTNSNSYQITSNAYQSTLSGQTDFVLTKLSSNGTILYSSFLGATGNETAYDVCYASGRVYCSGSTSSVGMPLRTGKVPDAGGDCCLLLADDQGGALNMRKCFVYGSAGSDIGYSVSFDSHASRICMTGVSGGVMTYNTALQAGQVTGGFVGTIDTALTAPIYITMIGSGVVPTSVAARTSNSTVYVAGYVNGTVPVSGNAFQAAPKGNLEGLMVSVDSSGALLKYGTYIGGTNADYSAAKVLLVDRGCLLRVIFGITTHSPDFPSTNNTYQPQKLNGIEDQPALAMFSTIPTANFTYFGVPCSKDYTFTLTTSCPYTNLVWNFGDRSPNVLGTNPVSHTFPSFGSYVVTATALTLEGDTIVKKANVIIGNPNPIDAGPDQTVCAKSTRTQLSATGGVLYRWSPGKEFSDSTSANPIVNPKKTTVYYLYGKDSFGCESVDSVVVIVHDIAAVVKKDTVICEGSYAQLEASGGQYYSWQPTNGLSAGNGSRVLAAPQTTTTYSVVAFDGVCFDTARVTVTVIPKPRLKMAPVPSICANTPVELGVTVTIPGSSDSDVVSYQWSPKVNINNPNVPNPVVTLSKDAWYKVTVVTKYGCVATDSVHIVMQNRLRITLSPDTALCEDVNGVNVRLRANGAATYEWSPGTGLSDSTSNSPLCTTKKSTTYRVIGRAGECIDTQYVRVTVYPRPTGLKARGDTTVCSNERVHLWIENGDTAHATFAWYPPQEFENPSGSSVYLHPGLGNKHVYKVIISNAAGCTTVDSVHVFVDNALQIATGPSVSACEGEQAALTITSNNDASTAITWTPNDGVWDAAKKQYVVTVTADKTYKVHAQRGSCTGDAEVSVHVKPNPVFELSADTSVCYGSIIQLHAKSSQNGMSYRWLRGTVPDTALDDALSANPTTHALTEDMHWTVEASLDGCIRTKDMTVHVLAMPSIIMPADTMICDNESASFHVKTSSTQSIRWEPSTGLDNTSTNDVVASPHSSTKYTATVVSKDGCTTSASFFLGVKRRVWLDFSIDPIHGGQVLSPNDSVFIIVKLHADSSIVSPLQFDVVCNANIVEIHSHPFSDKNGRRTIHFSIPAYTFQLVDTLVMKIVGKALQAAPPYSDVVIENIEIDSTFCPNYRSIPTSMSISSCYTGGRNVQWAQPLALSLRPNPVSDETTVQILSSEDDDVELSLVNSLGERVQTWTVSHSQVQTLHTINLGPCASGVYQLVATTAQQRETIRCIKY